MPANKELTGGYMNISNIDKVIYRYDNGPCKYGVNVMRRDINEEVAKYEPSNKVADDKVIAILTKLAGYDGKDSKFALEHDINKSSLSRYKYRCLNGEIGSDELREKLTQKLTVK